MIPSPSPTLVLLPGLDGTGLLFDPLLAHLGHDPAWQVLVLRYPSDRPMGYDELTAWASEALPAEGPLVLLGESFSGPIATCLAARHAERVRGLVLCCSFVRNPRPMLRPLQGWTRWVPVRAVPPVVLAPALLGLHAPRGVRQLFAQALASVAPAVLQQRLAAVLSVDVTARLVALRVPVLCLRARHDRLVPRAAGDWVLAQQPRARCIEVDGPHALLQVAPEAAARHIAAFVADCLGTPDTPFASTTA